MSAVFFRIITVSWSIPLSITKHVQNPDKKKHMEVICPYLPMFIDVILIFVEIPVIAG